MEDSTFMTWKVRFISAVMISECNEFKDYSSQIVYSSHLQFSSVQLLSCVWLFATPWIAAHQASLSITNSRSSLRFTSIESVMPSSCLILCRPLLLLPPIPPNVKVFSSESTLHMRWPKYWSFSFSIIPSKEIPGLISFRMDWLDHLGVQGTLKSPVQHHSSKASILQCSGFFTVQLSHPYMTTGKTIALTRWTFVGKVMSLLFNMLPSLVITFLPRSKRLLISWLQSPSAVILEPRKIKPYINIAQIVLLGIGQSFEVILSEWFFPYQLVDFARATETLCLFPHPWDGEAHGWSHHIGL